MGYFSNGTEGALYEELFCSRCIHTDNEIGVDKPCPIWMAHVLYAYELCNEEEHPGKVMLDMFIPREEPGYNGNGRCRMFVQDSKKEPLPAWVEEHVL